MSEPKTYTATDIERYHRGEMSAAEMHLLEKAALNDPALSDMLEGYAFTTTASADLHNLQNRLQQRIGQEDKGGGLLFGLPWLRIAALFVLVAGGGWLVFHTLSPNNSSLAESTKADAVTIQTNKTLLPTDSTSAVVRATPLPFSTDSLARMDEAVAVNTRRATAAGHKTKKSATGQLQPSDNITAKNENVQAASTLGLMRAEETNADSSALAGAVVANSPAPSARSANDTIKNFDIVLKRNNLSLDEVVITKAKRPQARRQPAVVIDTLEPEQGWSTFDDYIAENLHAPEELKTKTFSPGNVELSFRVDKEGNPTNITVTQSLCAKCDAEAIRLLKEGPKWKGKKGKIKIRFPQTP